MPLTAEQKEIISSGTSAEMLGLYINLVQTEEGRKSIKEWANINPETYKTVYEILNKGLVAGGVPDQSSLQSKPRSLLSSASSLFGVRKLSRTSVVSDKSQADVSGQEEGIAASSSAASSSNVSSKKSAVAQIDPEAQWSKFVVELLKCVTRDSEGNITGVNSDARRKVIESYLEYTSSGPRFPKFMKDHANNAGTVVITTDKNMSLQGAVKQNIPSGYNQDVLSAIGSMNVVQTVRTDMEGNEVGRGLYGGLAGNGESRDQAVASNLVKKLSPSLDQEGKETISLMGTRLASTDPQAYSSYDVRYLTDSFLPNAELVARLKTGEFAEILGDDAKELIDFYEGVTSSSKARTMKYLMNDEKSLKLAVSNTYNLQLDDIESQSLIISLGTNGSELSNTGKGKKTELTPVSFQPEVKPLLSCLYPQDYFYKHEFYNGILPVLTKQLANDPDLIKSALDSATKAIIERMNSDIAAGKIPSQIKGLDATTAIKVWRAQAEISFSGFMAQYPGTHWDSVCGALGLDKSDILHIDEELKTVWAKAEKGLSESLANKLRTEACTYDSKILAGLPIDLTSQVQSTEQNVGAASMTRAASSRTVGGDAQTLQAQRLANEAKIKALRELVSDGVTQDKYTDPVFAIDGFFHERDSYKEYFVQRDGYAMRPGTSPYTREEISRTEYFSLPPFTNLVRTLSDANISQTTPEIIKAIAELNRDMVTGQQMTDPTIVILQKGRNYFPAIVDKTTINKDRELLTGNGYTIKKEKEFDSLKSVTDLMQDEVAREAGKFPARANNGWMSVVNDTNRQNNPFKQEAAIPELQRSSGFGYRAANTNFADRVAAQRQQQDAFGGGFGMGGRGGNTNRATTLQREEVRQVVYTKG